MVSYTFLGVACFISGLVGGIVGALVEKFTTRK